MKHIVKDLTVIVGSIVLAIIIVQLDLIEKLLSISENIRIVGSFVGGLFFTSIFTTVPAIVFLGEISQLEPLYIVASVGAVGAVLGDFLIFYLFRNHVADDLDALIKRLKSNPLMFLLKNGSFRWFSILVGAFIIASPLPDELGIAMMGISKLKLNIFIPVSFTFNFIGILLIGLIAKAL